MKTLLITVFALIFSMASCNQVSEPKSYGPVVMAYYVPEQDYRPELIPVEKLTHIIYSFTKVIDGNMEFRNPVESGEKLEQLVAQKSRNKDLKVMIACGGWGADGFSDMASTQENRDKFIASVAEFIEKYRLDGIDIDWEYPGIPAAGTKAREEDKQNFTLLLKGLREALDQSNRPQTITFAAAGWKGYFDNVELVDVMKYADFINLMTYDQATGSSPYTSHHTALGWIKENNLIGTPLMEEIENGRNLEEEWALNWEPQSVENIVNFCINQGVRKDQIVIGGAFYGRGWKGVPSDNNGLYQKNEGNYGNGVPYYEIGELLQNQPEFTRYWDEVAQAPYLYNPNDSIWISYDDTVSLQLKTQYVIENNLAGIMFWQLGHDTKYDYSLLNAIFEASNPQ